MQSGLIRRQKIVFKFDRQSKYWISKSRRNRYPGRRVVRTRQEVVSV